MQPSFSPVSGWLLAGGRSQRMGGLDKGLQLYQGRPMALSVIETLRPQVSWLGASANRNLADYQALLGSDLVFADDPDLQTDNGPLAGILTGLRHAPGDWLMVCPCDSPRVPTDLVHQLLDVANRQDVDIVTPCTQDQEPDGTPCDRPHWVCSLFHKRVYPKLLDQFVKGERKVGRFIQSARWSALSFNDPSAFANMNTLESLHGRL